MPLYFEGQLQIFVKKGFENNDGEKVEYYEAYFVGVDEDDNDTVLKVNTKQNLSLLKGKQGRGIPVCAYHFVLRFKTFTLSFANL